jgi:hypothetical protein
LMPVHQSSNFKPACTAELYFPWANERIAEHKAHLAAFFELMWTGTATEQQLRDARPEPLILGIEAQVPQSRGILWDCRGAQPVPVHMGAQFNTHLNTELWNSHFGSCNDEQLRYFMSHGVLSLAAMDHRTVYQSPLFSLSEGIASVAAELGRIQAAGYVSFSGGQPFVPCLMWPIGAVAKAGSNVMRRISDGGAGGHPQTYRLDSEGVASQPINAAIKASGLLPREIKPMQSDFMRDLSIQRYVADRIGWTVQECSDDLRDMFYQIRNHIAEYWTTGLLFMLSPGAELTHVTEECCGMGYSHSSNVAQRFANSLVIMFLRRFIEADAAALREEAAEIPVLRAWLDHRDHLEPTEGITQARAISAAGYTDDIKWCVMTPPDKSKVVRSIEVWVQLASDLGLRTADARKRQAGSTVAWTGTLTIAPLGLAVIPQPKTQRALLDLALCIQGVQTLDRYRKMFGLLSFCRFILRLPKHTLEMLKGPLGASSTPRGAASSLVTANTGRIQHWTRWASKLCSTYGAPITAFMQPISLQDEAASAPTTRTFVWHLDAAIRGTSSPGIGGYSHGLYWFLHLDLETVSAFTINPLEFLSIIGCFIIFGALLHGSDFKVIIQSDSLVSVDIIKDTSSSPLLIYLHQILLNRPEVVRLAPQVEIGQVQGEGNPLADHLSRGNMEAFLETCRLLGVKPTKLEVPEAFKLLIKRAAEEARSKE